MKIPSRRLPPAQVLVGTGFVLLLLTALQGWVMVGIIAAAGEGQAPIVQELRRLHNLGLSGGFLSISFGLTMMALPLDMARVRSIYRVLLPSLLVAPVAFLDRVLSSLRGPLPSGFQLVFYSLQALSALGITISLVFMLVAIVRHARQPP